jgi:hypothetical protein
MFKFTVQSTVISPELDRHIIKGVFTKESKVLPRSRAKIKLTSGEEQQVFIEKIDLCRIGGERITNLIISKPSFDFTLIEKGNDLESLI